jgi:hypothetical protein
MNNSGDIDMEDFWEYSNPNQSEARFRAALADATSDTRLEIQTQIARTYSLRKRFDEAHTVLDAVLATVTAHEASTGIMPKVRIRYLLERGRTWRIFKSVARCLRSLGRCEETLAIQYALKAEHEAAGTTDAYVLEEIDEDLAALILA